MRRCCLPRRDNFWDYTDDDGDYYAFNEQLCGLKRGATTAVLPDDSHRFHSTNGRHIYRPRALLVATWCRPQFCRHLFNLPFVAAGRSSSDSGNGLVMILPISLKLVAVQTTLQTSVSTASMSPAAMSVNVVRDQFVVH